ncbi:hypothetical protein NIES2104_32070 [Leptolyngbya sp. NIES-2104]|nr:hypothetical protein NIES2104_32070 [Leptolyngbya sp. NIES-2104]
MEHILRVASGIITSLDNALLQRTVDKLGIDAKVTCRP